MPFFDTVFLGYNRTIHPNARSYYEALHSTKSVLISVRVITVIVQQLMTVMVQLSESQSKLIKTIARQNGFNDNFEMETSPGSVKGDNFLGIITRVTIKNKERKLELILKSASISEAFRKAAPIRKVYCRELYIYEKLFVEFKKLQNEFNISDPFTGYPKLFGTSSEDGQECLVMENLVETGYKLWNRKVPMNAEHIKAVFIEYAKFHSISLAMAHKKPKLFNELTRAVEEHVMQDILDNPEQMDSFVKAAFVSGSKALEGDPELTEVLRKFTDGLPDYFSEVMKNPKWSLVVTHGDCWCNNMMFKYADAETTRKISKVCILDWQIAKKASPAADLTYFFLAHSPKEILYDYKNYLKLYYDTVCKNLRDFSCDPEEVFPYSLLEQHWRKFINYGLNLSLAITKIMYCDDEAPDLAERAESGKDVMDSFSFDLKNAVNYNQRVKDLMNFVIDTELICV